MSNLKGRRILVTGAGGGLGGVTVGLLAEVGAEVVVADRTDESLADVVTDVGPIPLAFDLGSEESFRSAVGDLELDGLVNCAGYGGEISECVTSNITALRSRRQREHPGCVARDEARHRVDDPPWRGRRGQHVQPSLAGGVTRARDLRALQVCARCDYPDRCTRVRPHRIRVNSVHPTVVMTEMSASCWGRPEIGGPYLADMPWGRRATVDEIAGPIVFLLSDDASMISGVCLPVDGGYTAR